MRPQEKSQEQLERRVSESIEKSVRLIYMDLITS